MNAKPLLLVLACVALTSCSYVKNRTNDLLDVFWLDVDIGALASAQVRCTDFLATGAGIGIQKYPLFNLHGRYFGQLERGTGGLPMMGPMNLYSRFGEMAPVLEGSPDYPNAIQPPPMNFWFFYPTEPMGDRRGPKYRMQKRGWRIADCAIGATAILGVRVGISPGHLVDFVCGLFGYDPASDDVFGEGEEVDEPDRVPFSSRPR